MDILESLEVSTEEGVCRISQGTRRVEVGKGVTKGNGVKWAVRNGLIERSDGRYMYMHPSSNALALGGL